MQLFNIFKKKKTFSKEEVEKEYKKAIHTVQTVDGGNCASLVRDIKEYAKQFCSPKEGGDLLAQKAEFIRIHTFRAYQWRCYHTLGYKRGKFNSSPLWCQKWRNYEQTERLQSQRVWREMLSRVR